MKGLELAEKYYETFGAPMIREQFPEIGGLIAAGLTGSGSECYGYDDDVSGDHDFEPGFCLFLPGEEKIDRRTAFQLERAYAKLRKEVPPDGDAESTGSSSLGDAEGGAFLFFFAPFLLAGEAFSLSLGLFRLSLGL